MGLMDLLAAAGSMRGMNGADMPGELSGMQKEWAEFRAEVRQLLTAQYETNRLLLQLVQQGNQALGHGTAARVAATGD